MAKSMSGVPAGYQAIMPYLRVRDAAAAIRFYKKAFGAKEHYRLKMGAKIGHAEIEMMGAVVMLSDEFPTHKAVGPKTLKGTTVHLTVYVSDADAAVAKAVKAGAKIKMKVSDQFYGDRVGQIVDPFGHVWSINQRVKDVTPKDMQKHLTAAERAQKAAKPGRKASKKSAPQKAAAKKAVARKSARAKAVRKSPAKSAQNTIGKTARRPLKKAPARRKLARRPATGRPALPPTRKRAAASIASRPRIKTATRKAPAKRRQPAKKKKS